MSVWCFITFPRSAANKHVLQWDSKQVWRLQLRSHMGTSCYFYKNNENPLIKYSFHAQTNNSGSKSTELWFLYYLTPRLSVDCGNGYWLTNLQGDLKGQAPLEYKQSWRLPMYTNYLLVNLVQEYWLNWCSVIICQKNERTITKIYLLVNLVLLVSMRLNIRFNFPCCFLLLLVLRIGVPYTTECVDHQSSYIKGMYFHASQ